MVVNGLKLPKSFVILYDAIRQGAFACFSLKEPVDAYGNLCETDLEMWDGGLIAETAQLTVDFGQNRQEALGNSLEQIQETEKSQMHYPGFIPWITDFSRIVWFGRDPEDNCFCFDYRDDRRKPSIIFWDDAYWRRVAPDFDTLIDLYQSVPNPFQPEDGQRWKDRETGVAKTAQALSKMRTKRQQRRWPFGRQT